ncbi:MAG: hypothetical protein COB94_003520 [Gammaproteobacteria bacterium]|nr:hypothetical protein [Gammaproteobacteria bacterium]
MTFVHMIALAVRLFSVFLFLISIRTFSGLSWIVGDADALANNWIYVAAAFSTLCMAIILWKFPLTIAGKICPVKHENTSHESLSMDELYTLGFVILGIYLLFYVLSDALYWIIFMVSSNRNTGNYEFITIENQASMITTFAEFVIAIFLIFGANGLSKIILKFRYKE